MVHLCLGLVPVGTGRYSRACRQVVKTPLGRCSRCRPAAARPPAGPRPSQATYLRRWRARRAQTGVSAAMEGT